MKLGLKTNQLDDFVKFYIINGIVKYSDEYYIEDHNDYLLGIYFAIHEIIDSCFVFAYHLFFKVDLLLINCEKKNFLKFLSIFI